MQRRNDEKDGKDGKDAEPVNVDSLVNSLREEIIGTVVDSVKSIQVENVIRSLTVDRIYAKPKIFGAFANQYHLLYGSVEHFKEYKNDAPVYNTFAGDDIVEPLSVIVRDDCDEQREDSCCAKRIVVKSWGAGFTDTATVTRVIEAKIWKLTAAKPTTFQIRAYALENDQELLFYSGSKETVVYTMQYWDAIRVTPNMDSIPALIADIAARLPGQELCTGCIYEGDATREESLKRIFLAVYKTLQARNIKYVENINDGSATQKIKFPIEVLRTRQGICIETSFLMASVFEAIGFSTFVIKTYEHMFVGVGYDYE